MKWSFFLFPSIGCGVAQLGRGVSKLGRGIAQLGRSIAQLGCDVAHWVVRRLALRQPQFDFRLGTPEGGFSHWPAMKRWKGTSANGDGWMYLPYKCDAMNVCNIKYLNKLKGWYRATKPLQRGEWRGMCPLIAYPLVFIHVQYAMYSTSNHTVVLCWRPERPSMRYR